MLEIQIDQAGRRLDARAAAVEQQHGGLHRQRGDAGAADRGQESVDLRFGRCGRIAALTLGDAGAGAHQIDRRHRLHQEVGDAHLQQRAGDVLVEGLRDRDHRRPGADARHQPGQRLHLVVATGIEIDHHDGGVDVERVALIGGAAGHHGEIDCALAPKVARATRRTPRRR